MRLRNIFLKIKFTCHYY